MGIKTKNMTKKFKLKKESDLKIYSFSFRIKAEKESIDSPKMSGFTLAYSLDEAKDRVKGDIEKEISKENLFKNKNVGIDITFHANMYIKKILDEIEIEKEKKEKPKDIKLMNKKNFINSLQLTADKFLKDKDKKKVEDIIKKIKI
jgi:acyl-ACP thioesterase